MNDLPYAFYESVFWVGWSVRAFMTPHLCKTATELSGNIGIVAQQMTSAYKYHAVVVRNNRISDEIRWDRSNSGVPEHLWIEKDKFTYCVAIHIFESNEDKVSREIVDRLCFPNAMYFLSLQTTIVSKAWIDWACTAKRLKGLCIYQKLDDEAIALCKRLIEIGHLTQLRIGNEEYSEGMMEMMKLSLTQPHFKSLRFMEDGQLEKLLVFWSQNKETLRGKDLYLETTNPIAFLMEKLELCPQEKFDSIGRHHFYAPRTLFVRKPSHPYKLKYGGDEGDSHRAYVFFECVEGNANESEMSYFAKTRRIGILFT